MAKGKKTIGDRVGETEIALPPDKFVYQDDDGVLLGNSLMPGSSGRMTPLIISNAQFLPKSLKKIRVWLEKYSLQKDDVLANLVQALTGVISMDSEARLEFYRVFRETQLSKVHKQIEAIQTAMHLISSDDLRLQKPYKLLQKREKLLTAYQSQLKSQHADVHKLLYRELYPVLLRFDELNIKPADQDRMLHDLFRLFEYEDFAMKVTDQSMVNRAKKINNSTRDWFSKI
ncbi:MAG: hypothetical protein IIA59_08810 [Candidatus Marinimicrobia bacterium]|nr:hypothetical protein [Candidatus Neomarinimicrobiota bacterium]